jgi:tetratricopeptide (TPR) repeat protein
VALARLETEFANIRAAWRWAIESRDLDALRRFALPLSMVFVNQAQEGARLFAQAAATLEVTNPAHHAALSVVLIAQAEQLLHLGIDLEQRIALLEQALALLDPQEASPARLKALSLLGNAIWMQGDHRKAKTILEQGLAVARQQGAPAEIGDLLIRLALVEREISDQPTVMAFYQSTLTELRTLGHPVNLAHQLLIYGEYLVNHEQIQEGQQFLSESLALVQASGRTDFYPFILLHLAVATHKLGDDTEAETYLQKIVTISRAEDRIHPEALAHLFLGRVKLAQNELAEAEHHLHEGLRLGWTHKLTLVMTLALVCFAELYDAQNDPGRAVCLLTVALNHPATEKRDQQAATRHLQTLQNKLPANEFEQAVAQGNRSGLEEVVTQTLRRRPAVNGRD